LHNIEELAQSAGRNVITHKPPVSDIPETMLLSETALAKDWLSPEEDGIWHKL
jgi:hypothetical protein